MMRSALTAATLALAAASCATTTNDDHAASDQCGAAGYQSLIGSNIAAITLPADLNHRIIGPNTAVTRDYILTRLNIYTDANGVVTRVNCG